MSKNDKIEVENVNVPGTTNRVDRAKYEAMKHAFLTVMPDSAPGLTQNEVAMAVKTLLPNTLYPEGKTSGWWAKTVQLDLEAKGLVTREQSKPLRWHKS